MALINAIIKRDFPTFVAKAFQALHGAKLKRDAAEITYVDYVASELGLVATGELKRVCVSLPPRHLKTRLGIALAAYTLGLDPYARVMVLCYSERLARSIAGDVRALMNEAWYKQTFATRLAPDRAEIMDFHTTAGGGLFASWIGGGYTGRGADLLIIDDPVEINQANNLDVLEHVNDTFDNVIQNRLNSPKDSRIVIIAHRLNEFDLPGHALAQDGWTNLSLPLIAPARREYRLRDGRAWTREKGELLRPDVFDEKAVRRLRKSANFDTLYQQNVGRARRRKIKPKHFDGFSISRIPDGPVVLSIDPGFDSGDESSFTVVQAWVQHDGRHYLIDQWRAQAEYEEVEAAVRKLRRTYRAVKILIEAAGYGLALCRCRRLRKWAKKIKPGNRTKEERLATHSRIIRGGAILVPEESDFCDEFVNEVVDFSAGRALHDDQVDAMTQYLDYMATNPRLEMPPPRASAVYMREDGSSITQRFQPPMSTRLDANSLGRLGAIGNLPGLRGRGNDDPEEDLDATEQPLIGGERKSAAGLGAIGYGGRSQADRLAELQAVQANILRRLRSR